jgi:outer membrane lipoprotein-sorting protein
MKKILISTFLLAFGLGLIAVYADAQKLPEVLAKMIAAQGGRKALEAIKDTTSSGTAEMIQMGLNGTITIYQKEPDKSRTDFEVMGMVITRAYDGTTAWGVNPQTGANEVMSDQDGSQMKWGSYGNDALLNPAKYGISFELKPKEKVSDKDYIVLDQVFKDGFRNTMYLDPETYLVFKTKAKIASPAGTEIEMETLMSDYQKEGDVVVAKAMTIYQGGQEFMRIKFSKVAFNTGLEDVFFKMPGQ